MINLFLKWLRPFFKQDVITSRARRSRAESKDLAAEVLQSLYRRDLLPQEMKDGDSLYILLRKRQDC